MAETNVASPAPKKGRRWLRILAVVAGLFVVLVVVLYFVATSSAFFTGVILPKVGKAMNATVTVSDASIHPFSEVVLKNLKVQTTGTEPLVTATEVRARYSLMDIIGGKINVQEVALTSPTITLVQNPDGTSNLDPITKGQKSGAAETKSGTPAKSSKPAQIDIKKIALTGGTIRTIKLYPNGNRDLTELANVNVTLDDLKNGQTGKFALGADIKMDTHPPAPGAAGSVDAKVTGNLDFTLSADLKPVTAKGKVRFQVNNAQGALAELATLATDLDCEVSPTEVKQLALRFAKGGTQLGEIRVSGPLDMEKSEGRLVVQALAIDKNLLNLAGAKNGLDFGGTTLSSSNVVQLNQGGKAITATGEVDLHQFQVTRAGQTTTPLELHANYATDVNLTAGNAVLRELVLTADQRGKPLLKADLSQPMSFSWGGASTMPDSTLSIGVTGFNLADWKPFIGNSVSAGILNAKLNLVSKQGGDQLAFDLNSGIEGLTVGAGSEQLSQAGVTVQLRGQAVKFKQFTLPECKLQLSQQNQPLVSVTASGSFDQATTNADFQVSVKAVLAQALRALANPEVSASSGTLELDGHVTAKGAEQTITGKLALADFTGKIGKSSFRSYGATADLDVSQSPKQTNIRKATGKLSEGANSGGAFDLSGTFDPATKSAQMQLKLTDVNERGLRPFVEPMLTDKELVSISLNINASAQSAGADNSSVKGDVQFANLVVKDSKTQTAASPLAAKLQLDTSLQKQVADIRQFQITLTPTSRAANQVQLTGRVDISNTNAITGNLKLTADAIDLTAYYDTFAGSKTAGGTTSSASTKSPAPAAGPQKEPAAMKLPFRDFTAEANIKHIYLREIDISDFQTTAKLQTATVAVNPFKLQLNGAPVSGTLDADVSVPGFKYALTFDAQHIPLTPIIDSFQPESKGQLSGTLVAGADIKGAGITGESLQKNLQGNFSFASTNLNLAINNIKNKMVKTICQVIVAIPEYAKNPAGLLDKLDNKLSGKSNASASDELNRSVVNSIAAKCVAGSGKIDLQQGMVESPLFQADATGTITLAPILTNSTLQIPVSISLERITATRLALAPSDTPTNVAYVKLPDFFTMKGTVGDPKKEINAKALIALTLQTAGNLAGTNNQTGTLLQNLGGLLGNKPATNNSSTPSSQSRTNQKPKENLLDRFLNPKQ